MNSFWRSVDNAGQHTPGRLGFLFPFIYSFLVVAAVTALGLLVRGVITPTNLVMPYLLGVVTVAVFWGRGPAIFASVLGVIAFDFFLVPPYLTFVVEDTEYVITFLALFLVGILISGLTSQIKQQVSEAREREARITSLYNLSETLAISFVLEDTLHAIVQNISTALKAKVRLYYANPAPDSSDPAVKHAFTNREITGLGTPKFPDSTAINFPLVTNSGVLGVLSFELNSASHHNIEDRFPLFEAYANLSALALERIQLSKEASQAQILRGRERLQTALLDSISHDFRTPLVTIIDSLSSLENDISRLNEADRISLVHQALSEAERLNRFVANLLNISRVESGALTLNMTHVDVQDLIGATLEQMKNRIDRQILIEIPEPAPTIWADFVLMEQALINLIDNALKYSPVNAPIDIRVKEDQDEVAILVADRGRGIATKDLPAIFQKFYRGNISESPDSIGLGLAIVKGIVDAHDAQVEVRQRGGGGSIFRIAFPKASMPAEAAA